MFLSVQNLDDIFLGRQVFLFSRAVFSRLGAVKRKVCSMCSWNCVNNIYKMNKDATCGYRASLSYFFVVYFATSLIEPANTVCHVSVYRVYRTISSLIAQILTK